jgi:hypothetical protein
LKWQDSPLDLQSKPATSQTELANAMKSDKKKTMTLIDNRGVGKPEKSTQERTMKASCVGKSSWSHSSFQFSPSWKRF